MYVLSLNFSQKVVMTNLLYSNLMKYNIIYIVTKVQLVNKRIICSKRLINAKKNTHFLDKNVSVLSPTFWPWSVFYQDLSL